VSSRQVSSRTRAAEIGLTKLSPDGLRYARPLAERSPGIVVLEAASETDKFFHVLLTLVYEDEMHRYAMLYLMTGSYCEGSPLLSVLYARACVGDKQQHFARVEEAAKSSVIHRLYGSIIVVKYRLLRM
jgi:hypothetical protein